MAVKNYTSEEIRNVALVGHAHAGKTALADAIAFDAGVSTRIGRTAESTSLFDLEPEEVHRGGSITSHFGWVDHKGIKINLIDCPGDQNFFLDGFTALAGVDAVVAVVSAPDGVQLQAKRAWALAEKNGLARAVLLNKMDRATADWSVMIQKLGDALHAQPVPLQLPIGSGEAFNGVVDLFRQKALTWPIDNPGMAKEGDVPADLAKAVSDARAAMIESIVSTDDAMLEKYLETGDVAEEQVRSAFTKAMQSGRIVPVLFANARMNVGVRPLLELIASSFPNPLQHAPVTAHMKDGQEVVCNPTPDEPFIAQVVKTFFDEHAGQVSMLRIFSGHVSSEDRVMNANTKEEMRLGHPYVSRGKERTKVERFVCGDIIAAVKLKDAHTGNTFCATNRVCMLPKMQYPAPMMSYVIIAQDKKDTDRVKTAVSQLMEEDPTLSMGIDDLSHHLVLSGMGNGHLDSVIGRINRRFKITLTTGLPTVPYRETFAKPVKNVEGKHKKQTGGAGQFGVCFINVDPLPRSSGFEFKNDIFGGAIPKPFIPSVEKGVVDRAQHGLAAGYPVVDFRVSLIDGKYHPVDSKDIAFQMAGVKALKVAMQTAGMKILEPHYKMEITVPTEKAGDIMGDITSRRGHIAGMNAVDTMTVVNAVCPLSEIQRYVADLQSMTQGQGMFTMAFDSYREVPEHLVEKIRKESPYRREEKDEDE